MVNIQSTQEEADTLLILYAVAVSCQGNTVHIYSCDTDVLVLALRRVPDLKANSVIIMGTGDKQRQIKLKPIYVALGAKRAAALTGFHALEICVLFVTFVSVATCVTVDTCVAVVTCVTFITFVKVVTCVTVVTFVTGSDTTGHIKGKGKSSCFKVWPSLFYSLFPITACINFR